MRRIQNKGVDRVRQLWNMFLLGPLKFHPLILLSLQEMQNIAKPEVDRYPLIFLSSTFCCAEVKREDCRGQENNTAIRIRRDRLLNLR
jgi:hypothetical protein